jgi:hypothetical protein
VGGSAVAAVRVVVDAIDGLGTDPIADGSANRYGDTFD